MIMKRILFLLTLLVVSISCIEDLSKYNYKKTNKVTYKSVIEGYTFTSGEEVEMVAPIEFAENFENEADIDKTFEINWYLNEELVATGYRIKYTFKKVGGFSMILKVTNKETGEVYLSDNYSVQSKSAIGWGWMLLSDHGDGNSSLSFIAPNTMFVSHKLEEAFELPEPLGKGPKNLHYYYVLGSIPGNYVSGLPKVVVNQQSGTVTLDGRNLLKDKWMSDEFGGVEPESDFTMPGFAWKRNYYLIQSAEGNIYVRTMHRDYEEIPFYGTYSSMPYTFEGGANITYMQSFQNVTYWTANEDKALLFDSLNSRFLVFVPGGYGEDVYENYCPKCVYLSYYDETGTFDPSVPKVNNLGQGTRCLAAGAYEISEDDGSGYGGIATYPNYVALLDLGGSGNYQIYTFKVNPLGEANHIITENTMTPFSGSSLINDKSVILMSSNFEKNPYFYFTDGDKNLYVYSMATHTHALAHTATSRITHLSNSPIVCEFKNYGGNSEAVNWRMAVVQEKGQVDIIDVATDKMVKVFEGSVPNLLLKSMDGFGDVKDIVWATNYEGEY